MDKRVQVLIIMATIALIVTVVLYSLFENFALFENATKGIKLGGSVAFFFIFFTTEFGVIKNLHCDNLAPIRENMKGEWKYVTESKGPDADEVITSHGTANIQPREEGKITVIGNIDGRQEVWEADEVVLTESKLVYFFDVPMLRLTGVTNLRFTYSKKSPLTEMRGYWILSGQEGRGNVVFTRMT